MSPAKTVKPVFELAWLPRADKPLRMLCLPELWPGWAKPVSLASENQTTSITGTVSTTVTNPWKAGFGEGATHAMDRITDYYLKLASDMFPVLEVDSGRNVEIVISNGISIERNTKP